MNFEAKQKHFLESRTHTHTHTHRKREKNTPNICLFFLKNNKKEHFFFFFYINRQWKTKVRKKTEAVLDYERRFAFNFGFDVDEITSSKNASVSQSFAFAAGLS